MLKFFSVNKNQVGVLSTLVVLILLGAGYFFVYLPNNERNVQERRFLCLQNIDNNIRLKIENSVSMLNNLLMDYPHAVKGVNKKPDASAIENFINATNIYIDKYPKRNFTLLPVERLTPSKTKAISVVDDSAVVYKITVEPAAQQFILSANKAIKGTGYNDSLTMGVRFGFDQFVKPLLPADVFDHYIVFSTNTGNSKSATDKGSIDKVVYQNFPSGLSYKTRDSLLTFKNGIITPGVRSLTIGGTDYKVFSQPVSFGDNSQWIVVGLVSGKNYQSERNQLPVWVVLLLLTAAVGMIVSLPWIKLYHMGNKDKLTVTDGVASVLVAMLLMSLLFFMFFNQNLYLSDPRASTSSNSLANHISQAFRNEINTANNTLDQFDALYHSVNADAINVGTDSLQFNHSISHGADSVNKTRINYYAKDIIFDQVYWLDKSGQEIKNWTKDNQYIPHSNLGTREYFKRTIDSNFYRFNDTAFYLDQIVSRTSGVFTSVIAKKPIHSGAAAIAMTFTAKSLSHVILPDGYQFAIIDTSGEVLYHSLEDRNLNENLKNELADSSQLISCLEAKSDTNFKTAYYGRSYNIKIKPFKDLPYFTVIFEDQEYNDTRDTESYAFTISMLICLLLFLILQFTIVFFVSSKQSFFKKQLFETSWIGPKEFFHQQYNLTIVLNISVIVLLVSFFDLRSFLKYVYLVFFCITFIAIFSNTIYALYYRKHNHYNYHFKKIALGWLCGFVLVIDILAGCTLEARNFSSLLFDELALILLCAIVAYCCLIVYSRKKKMLRKAYAFKNKKNFPWTFTHSFALMATTRLIVMSGIPVAFFFMYSFNYEQNLDTRYKQYRFAKALNQRTPSDSIKHNSLSCIGVYADNVFINKFKLVAFSQNKNSKELFFDTIANTAQIKGHKRPKQDSSAFYSGEDSLTVKLLSAFRLHKNDVAVRTNNMNLASVDSVAFFNNLSHEQTNNNDTTTTRTYYKTGSNKYIGISSKKNIYRLSNKWIFWPLLILLLGGFYYMIHNIIRKLFAINLPLQNGWKDMDEKILLDNSLNSLLLIVGSPGSGKLKKLKDRIKTGQLLDNKGTPLIMSESYKPTDNVFVADLIRIPVDNGAPKDDWEKCKKTALKESNYLVIINHFEYNIKDPKTNSTKLDLLESLMLQGKSKIMIISTVHPLTFLDSFNDEQKSITNDQKGSDSPDEQPASTTPLLNGITESELERWHVLLGHFRIIIEPLHDTVSHEKDLLKKNIAEETRYTHYLYGMQEKALDTIPKLSKQGMGLPSDSLIFKLQLSSHYFYTYIWQSLTKEEKFLLYDLAEDGLVNPYDDYNLSMLIYKGLILREHGTLMLFNKGFRNYILTAIGTTEVDRIKAQVKDNGNWASLRAPLNLAILAILIFLIASQQEAYTKIITYVTALGAGVPAVLRIFSFVGTSKSTQKTS